MEKPFTREIWEMDSTVSDLLIQDNQADQGRKKFKQSKIAIVLSFFV